MKTKESGFDRIEKGVIKEEHKISKELKKDEKSAEKFIKSHTFRILLVTVVFAVLIIGIIYLTINQDRVSIEKSEIKAPVISLSPAVPGILENVVVKEGDMIPADTVVAKVNGVPIKSEIEGLVIAVQDTPGQFVSSQTAVVQMIDPHKLMVVGKIAEDKGLKDAHAGQKATFTVDAFSSKKYSGVVESVSLTSVQS
ncbi:MAG: HlyD family efflux transporter periplasmic adaptor subunit, partial [Candidatus Woesearchaeota archaeon]|nr:HlyD family efflux transporter periplasmic adaptor subunit [Candidatus Woesearchaeota archaeon]